MLAKCSHTLLILKSSTVEQIQFGVQSVNKFNLKNMCNIVRFNLHQYTAVGIVEWLNENFIQFSTQIYLYMALATVRDLHASCQFLFRMNMNIQCTLTEFMSANVPWYCIYLVVKFTSTFSLHFPWHIFCKFELLWHSFCTFEIVTLT